MGKLKTIKRINNFVKAKKAQEEAQKQQAAQALANASAVTDSGRTTTVVNDTTNAPATSGTAYDELIEYVGDVRNRSSRRKRGAPMAQSQGVLGQPTTLGV